MEFNVKFNDLHKIVDFVSKTSKAEFDIDILQGRYILNAKSLMALFSLDLRKDIRVRLNTYEEDALRFTQSIEEHLTKSSRQSLKEGLQKWGYQTN